MFTGFSYDPPVVKNVTPNVFDAALNGTLTLTIDGFNFGLFNSPNLTVSVCKDEDCVTHLTCNASFSGFPVLMNTPDRELSCSLYGDDDVLVGPHAVRVVRHKKASTDSDAMTANITAQCEPGYFGDAGENCTLCADVPALTGAVCPGHGQDPYPLAGYSLVSRLQMVPCSPAEACLGGPATVGIDVQQNCAEGYSQQFCRCTC